MIADEVVNKLYVEARPIGTDGVITALPKLHTNTLSWLRREDIAQGNRGDQSGG